ncbi:hypothetical protein ACSFA8_23400 [Variovorax sp. RT4R15]|uniref:hypothetical protein n=1 Tax=Variovorax sp. RT4R15 TaxID=3443737 RepID=UPI003F47E773
MSASIELDDLVGGGMIPAGAIDDELSGARDNWQAFAERFEKAGTLGPGSVRIVLVLTAFSELVRNGNRHFENFSLMRDEPDQALARLVCDGAPSSHAFLAQSRKAIRRALPWFSAASSGATLSAAVQPAWPRVAKLAERGACFFFPHLGAQPVHVASGFILSASNC